MEIINGSEEAEFLLLQGRPIDEPVVQHGPFVMNYPAEIRDTFMEFQQTESMDHCRDPEPGGDTCRVKHLSCLLLLDEYAKVHVLNTVISKLLPDWVIQWCLETHPNVFLYK